MDEQGRAERKGERVARRRGVERAREYRISSRVRRARSGRRIKEWEEVDQAARGFIRKKRSSSCHAYSPVGSASTVVD